MLTVPFALLLIQASTPVVASLTPPSTASSESIGIQELPAPNLENGNPTEDTEAPGEAEEASREMEELREVEANSLKSTEPASPDVLSAVRRLGVANPLRDRMLDAYGDSPLHEQSAPPELPLITDLARFDVGLVKDEYDIPVEMQPLVAQYIQFFQGPGRKWFRNWMSRSTRFIPLMQPILESNGLPKDTVYLAMIESGFSTSAYSWAHAVGPWQFISGTAKLMGLKVNFWVDERKDPIKSTRAAAQYLNQLHEQLGHWYLAWAAYNTGGNRVRRVMERKGTSDFWVLSDGRGLARETRHYVPKLIACALVAKHPKAFGFTDEEFNYLQPLDYEEVKIYSPTDLGVIAQAAGTTAEQIRDLNPELRRWYTPPTTDAPYTLRIPKGTEAKFAENFPKVAPRERLGLIVHHVHRGETLSSIAGRYHTATQAILQFNHLKNTIRLRTNTELAIPVPSEASAQLAQMEQATEEQERPLPRGRHRRARTHGVGASGTGRTSYEVRSGDTLWSLSQRFRCSVEDLLRWNGLSSQRQLKSGARLVIFEEQPSHELVRAGKHTLSPGETLWGLARQYGLSVEKLKQWNHISDHHQLRAGQALTLVAP